MAILTAGSCNNETIDTLQDQNSLITGAAALSPAASALRDSMSRSVGITELDSRMEHNMDGTYIQVIHSRDTWVAVFLAVLSA